MLPLLLAAALAALPVQAQPTAQDAPPAGLQSWKSTRHGVTLELTQLTPDQNRAFFLGRGFPRAEAERYAASCGFMAVLRNESAPAAIAYRLAEWRAVTPDGQRRPLTLKEQWMAEWQARGLAQAQRIAFEWSQLPSEQTFEPGDWNQGMLTVTLPRGARFDLEFTWSVQGAAEKAVLKGVTCATEN